MERRKLLFGSGAVLTAALAGHTGIPSGGDVVIDETIGDDQYVDYDEELFTADVDEGQTITIAIETEEDTMIHLWVVDPDLENVLEEKVRTEETFTLEAKKSGTYRFDLVAVPHTSGRGTLKVVLD